MPLAEKMTQLFHAASRWNQRRIGITGATGSLGRALTKTLRRKGCIVIGLTHGSIPKKPSSAEDPHEWVRWQCGEEKKLDDTLKDLDILILNHGINPHGSQTPEALTSTLEVNALSSWRLIQRFESLIASAEVNPPRELWINTSEAEIQPALSPAYELSKRLIGQLVSLRWYNRSQDQKRDLRIRKLVLGPFRSELNPIGLMAADVVAKNVILQAEMGFNLIIVTPNPLTYIFMPITELVRFIYSNLVRQR